MKGWEEGGIMLWMAVFEYLDWKAGLQILILALIIYWVLNFLRLSPGAGVLRGFTLLTLAGSIGVLILAKALGLEVIDWLITRFVLPFSVVAVLVLFHPELRKGLWRIGQRPFLGFFATGEIAPIGEIVEAVTRMSQEHIGALIAIERDVSLRAYADGGVRLDAELSSSLLLAVFQPGGLLHDGAVIIRGERIVAARCIFPLSENEEKTFGLGTRHRAGIGITEETDAIAVVVSEETGRISLAMGGELTTGLDRESLRSTLRKIYLEERLAVRSSVKG